MCMNSRLSHVVHEVLLLYVLLILAGCGSKDVHHSQSLDNKSVRCYNLTDCQSVSPDDVFESVEVVPLLFEGESYPDLVTRLQVTDSLFMIEDKRSFLHLFDKDGNYLVSSDAIIGEGPEEITTPLSYALDPLNGLIEVLTPHKLMSYDLDLHFIKSSHLPTGVDKDSETNLFFSHIESVGEDTHLLLPTISSDRVGEVVIFNSKKETIDERLSYKDDIILPFHMQDRYLFFMNDGSKLFVPPAITNIIYSLSEDMGTLSPLVQFDLGDNSLTRENMGSSVDRQILIESSREILLRILPTSNRIFLVVKGKGNTMRSFHTVVIDTARDMIYRVNLYSEGRQIFPLIMDVDDKYAYTVVDKETLMNQPSLLLDKSEQISSIADSIEDELLLVLKYGIRD